MKKNLLHMFLSAALKVRLYDFQKEFKVCHGVAVRAIAKANVLKLTQEKIDSLTSSELHKLWYSKSNKKLKKNKNLFIFNLISNACKSSSNIKKILSLYIINNID